ncbi:MAG: phospho-N-acetylmuramoyl-pentapeptide-transferase [Bacteroidetes bacterium GWF2_38_335]|nr:MAG: phospho-N-acetylmuramoyl-pentapeptide-transferase [Bacteroidetes bacterium GWF2_38_335]OFY79673.1 MAG: phospho-N-acetylmuramoyl-pentapeptide-transferase [Bacteroidetes bacterium RIFOXYA12_FULL_38_20]HBS89003.1 phospho-N-acetylmuramoyl-pentapeptide-transferase [Bacteroidales bacterium]
MFYYLFTYLDKFDLPGAGMFYSITFRAAMALIASLVVALIFGKKIIRFLQRKQIGEEIRNLDLEGQYSKKGTPTMGGIIILSSIVIPTLLFAQIHNVYIYLMLITTVWLGTVGFIDDYIKVFKKNKQGLAGKFKIIGQVGLGFIVGLTLYLSSDVLVRDTSEVHKSELTDKMVIVSKTCDTDDYVVVANDHKSTTTTIPFFANNELDYADVAEGMLGYNNRGWGRWVLFVIMTIIVVTAVSNGANLTDGLDGLATGTSAIIGTTLGILAYVSGNTIFSDYLNIMYIPNSGELLVFSAAFIGALIGFLWYNSYPAQVFMGDTGSLALGGIIAVFAIIIRKELLIPILCGIFFVESLSVMLQVAWFKRTKRKYGEGRRLFKMAPIHHHFQKLGYTEPKIVSRFWIVGIALAVFTIVTLKMR